MEYVIRVGMSLLSCVSRATETQGSFMAKKKSSQLQASFNDDKKWIFFIKILLWGNTNLTIAFCTSNYDFKLIKIYKAY